MSAAPERPSSPGPLRGIGQPVTVTRGYPVSGTVEVAFFSAAFTEGILPVAVIRVAQTAGLYHEGDLFIARVSELEAAAEGADRP